MNNKQPNQNNAWGEWIDTSVDVWDATEVQDGRHLEFDIVTARCSACGRWAEQVNIFSSYLTYDYCPHCGVKMKNSEAKIKSKRKSKCK